MDVVNLETKGRRTPLSKASVQESDDMAIDDGFGLLTQFVFKIIIIIIKVVKAYIHSKKILLFYLKCEKIKVNF